MELRDEGEERHFPTYEGSGGEVEASELVSAARMAAAVDVE